MSDTETQCVVTKRAPVISLPDLKFGRFLTSGRTAAVSRLRESLVGRGEQTRLWACLGGRQELGVRRPEFWVVKGRQSPETPRLPRGQARPPQNKASSPLMAWSTTRPDGTLGHPRARLGGRRKHNEKRPYKQEVQVSGNSDGT